MSYYQSSGGDSEEKLFVGGLSWETTQDDLSDYFSKYGTVSKVILKTDPNTGRSRGFAFIQFEDKDVISTVLSSSHTLNGRQIDPKRAKGRAGPEPVKKVFIGGLDPNTEEDELRSIFGGFGVIENVEWPFDRVNNVKKTFAFVTFDTEDACNDAVRTDKQWINGRECSVKKAAPKTEGGRGGFGGGRGGGRGGGGRGGGRGRGGGYGGSYGGSGYGSSGYGQGSYGSGYGGSSGYDYNSYYGNGQSYGSGGYGGYGSGGSSWGSGYGGGQGGGYKKPAGRGGYHPYNTE